MNTRWEHLEGATGILFLLLVLAVLVVGSMAERPADNAPAPQFAAALLQSELLQKLSAWLTGLAGLSFLWFAGTLRATLYRVEGEPGRLSLIAFIAGALWALMWLLRGQFFSAAVGLADYYAHPEGAKTALLLAGMPVTEEGPLLPAALAGATALVTLRTETFPRWYGRASAILSPLLLIGSGLSVFGLAFPILPLSFMLFFLWILITSLILIRKTD